MKGNFIIIQDAKTERTWLRHAVDGDVKLTQCPKSDYHHLRLLATLIRHSDNPEELMKHVVERIQEDDEPKPPKPLPPYIPGFFIPPEELDGLEDENA